MKSAKPRFATSFWLLAIAFALTSLFMVTTWLDQQSLQKQRASNQAILSRVLNVSDALNASAGFGGAIHDFKNYVLRGETQYASGASRDFAVSQVRLNDLTELAAEGVLPPSVVSSIRFVFDDYQRKLEIARQMVAQGAEPSAIDAAVRVDDTPALVGFQVIRDKLAELRMQGEQLDGLIGQKGSLVSLLLTLNLALAIVLILFIYRENRQRTAEKVAAQQEALRSATLLDEADEAVLEINASQNIVRFNNAACRLWGYTKAEVIGQPLDMLVSDDLAIRHEKLVEGFFQATQTEPMVDRFSGNWRKVLAKRKDGSNFPAQLTLSRFDYQGLRFGAAVVRDMTSQLEEEQQTAEKMTVLEEASRQKSEFLANMSHEIRTPLTGVLGMTDMLLMEQLEKDHAERLKIIKSCGNHLLQILNDILDLSKIEAGMMKINNEPFVLETLLEDVQSVFRPVVEGKNLTLNTRVKAGSEKGVRLMGDPARLRQVVFNLVGNAVKFTEEGKVLVEANVQATKAGGYTIEIKVIDTGIGIPAEKLNSIFGAFEQVEGNYSRSYGGTGLGLAISKKLVNQMAGTLTVESKVGEGSTFTVEMACSAFVERRASSRDVSVDADAEKIDNLDILLAEDNEINARLFQVMLGKLNHRITLATDGKQAVKLAKERQFDVILMDINMPLLNGRDAFRAIRAEGKNQRTPAIALTAGVMDSEQRELRSIGFRSVVGKPVNWQDLQRAMETACAEGMT